MGDSRNSEPSPGLNEKNKKQENPSQTVKQQDGKAVGPNVIMKE